MIRFGNINDLNEILELVKLVKIDIKNRNLNIWQDDYPNIEIIKDDLNNKSLVFILDNKIVGFMATLPNKVDLFEDSFNIHNNFLFFTRVMVNPNYRRLGIAKEMFEHAFKLDYSSFRITVVTENTNAKQLYINLGFKLVGNKEYPWGAHELYEKTK